jgi:EAL domain-containing protein (putative c-di-GMP-specific phosphodiesterase class I)
VAVNLSTIQFQQPTLVETVKRILRETSLPPHLLELEITESVAMQNIDHTLSMLRSLADLGVSIAIDDFGTGYSSFSYLTKFPVHTLKIDRSFIQDLLYDGDDTAIVAAIIAMTHSLRRRVVAEAVETEAQLEFLRKHDCDEAQGYLFGKPAPPEEFYQMIERINTTTYA